jgi:hypothetical protein
MTDRVLVFTRKGVPLGELDAQVVRSWQLQRYVRAERAVMQIAASTVNRSMTQFRNLVVVISDKHPKWCGVIWDTRDWADNRITVTMYAAEYLLAMRRTQALEKYDGVPHTIFAGLLKSAQKDEHLLIQISGNYIQHGGLNTDKEYNRENIFQAVNDLAAEAEFYWWLEPIIATTNRLQLRAVWRKQRGVDYVYPLVQGSNFIDLKVTEICNVANRIYASGQVEDWNDPFEYIAQDAFSRSLFGLVEDSMSDHNITEKEALEAFGKSELTKRRIPRIKMTGKVTSTPYPKIGDKVTVQMSADSIGYSTGASVAVKVISARIKSVVVSPEEEYPTIVCDNLFWDV